MGLFSRLGSGWEEVYLQPGCRSPNAAGESDAVADVVFSQEVPIPTGFPGVWGWEVLGWVFNRGIGSSTLMFSGGVRFGGVAGSCGGIWAGVAGRVGRGVRGGGVRRPPNRPPVGCGVGKNSVCAGVRRHVARITGLRI